jgi:hypothetical protein
MQLYTTLRGPHDLSDEPTEVKRRLLRQISNQREVKFLSVRTERDVTTVLFDITYAHINVGDSFAQQVNGKILGGGFVKFSIDPDTEKTSVKSVCFDSDSLEKVCGHDRPESKTECEQILNDIREEIEKLLIPE